MTPLLTVSPSTIITLSVELVLVTALPVILLLLWRKKTHGNLLPALIGAGSFVVFALVLEQLLHSILLRNGSASGAFLTGNPWAYTLYACLAAGIFEETGRLLAFRIFPGRFLNRADALAYGIGHGGAEALLVTGLSALSSLILAILLAMGLQDTLLAAAGENAEAARAQLESITSVNGLTCLWAVLERVSAMLLHCGLSVLVYNAARRGRFGLYPAAILLHGLANVPAALYQYGVLRSLPLTEGLVFVVAAAGAGLGLFVYRRTEEHAPGLQPGA